MSLAHTLDAPVKRRWRLSWLAGGAWLTAMVTSVVIAAWPASAADQARTDGERYGAAVGRLYAADSAAQVDAALSDVHAAAAGTRDHAGDAVADQVADEEDALARAADGFIGSRTPGDDFEADLYQAELDTAVGDLGDQAEQFRTQGREVRQAFWDGYQDGLDAA